MTNFLNRPKTLIVVPNDALGGAEQYLKMVARYYLDREYEVYVVFLKRKRHNGWEDLDHFQNLYLLYGAYDSELKGLTSFFGELRKLKRKKLRYIFTSHVHLTGVMGILRKIGLVKADFFVGRESTVIFDRFNGIKRQAFKSLYVFGYPQVDLLICQTDFMREQLIRVLPKSMNKIRIMVIPNPIDPDIVEKQSREEIDTSSFGNYIVSAGRLIHLKGYDLLIRAFSKLPDKSLKLVILGEGDERLVLEELVQKEKLEHRVIFMGLVDNVYPYFKNATACVVSSRIEGFPNVLLQMMSQNSKVISTLCAGGMEVIPGIFTCSTEDIAALYNTLDEALNTNTEDRRAMFDIFLKKRTIYNFIGTVEDILSD
ncbi:MAG: glycosyltransferase [Maribacter sp.]|nr:glycosyltransferase [Maribacter sp.]